MSGFHLEVQALARSVLELERIRPELKHASEFEFALLEEALLTREPRAPATTLARWSGPSPPASIALVGGQPCTGLGGDGSGGGGLWDLAGPCGECSAGGGADRCSPDVKTLQREENYIGQLKQQALLEQGSDWPSTRDRRRPLPIWPRGCCCSPIARRIESALIDLLRQLRAEQDQHWTELTPWMQDQELVVEVFEQVLLASEDQSSCG